MFGIDDVAMLVLPDLPDLFAGAPEVIAEPPRLRPHPSISSRVPPALPWQPEVRKRPPALAAPRLDRNGYRGWASAIATLLRLMRAPRAACIAAT